MTADILDDFDTFGESETVVAKHSSSRLYYHLTNQTAAGGSAEFPVVTDVALKDLRIVQWYADGSCREVPLFDGDGVRTSVLEPSTVFLDSIDDASPRSCQLEAVCVAGKIEPSVIEVLTAPGDAVRIVRVRNEFMVDIVDPQSGAYFAITARDREGNRYPIGTFGILAAE